MMTGNHDATQLPVVMLGGGGGRIKGGRVLDYTDKPEPPDVQPVPVDDGQDERAPAEVRRRDQSAGRSISAVTIARNRRQHFFASTLFMASVHVEHASRHSQCTSGNCDCDHTREHHQRAEEHVRV